MKRGICIALIGFLMLGSLGAYARLIQTQAAPAPVAQISRPSNTTIVNLNWDDDLDDNNGCCTWQLVNAYCECMDNSPVTSFCSNITLQAFSAVTACNVSGITLGKGTATCKGSDPAESMSSLCGADWKPTNLTAITGIPMWDDDDDDDDNCCRFQYVNWYCECMAYSPAPDMCNATVAIYFAPCNTTGITLGKGDGACSDSDPAASVTTLCGSSYGPSRYYDSDDDGIWDDDDVTFDGAENRFWDNDDDDHDDDDDNDRK